MNEDNLHSWIEPELEARIVALVVGEASDFESEELERLISEKPELALFRDRMTAMHGMLGRIGAGEAEVEGEWKLSAEHRDVVLDVLDGTAEIQVSAPGSEETETVHSPTKRRAVRWIVYAAAASLAVAFFGLSFPALQSAKYRTEEKYDVSDSSLVQWYETPTTASASTTAIDQTVQHKAARTSQIAAVGNNPSTPGNEANASEALESIGDSLVYMDLDVDRDESPVRRNDSYAMIGNGGYAANGHGGGANVSALAAGGDIEISVTAGNEIALKEKNSLGFPVTDSQEAGNNRDQIQDSSGSRRIAESAPTDNYVSGTAVVSAPDSLSMPDVAQQHDTSAGSGAPIRIGGGFQGSDRNTTESPIFTRNFLGGANKSRGSDFADAGRVDGTLDASSSPDGFADDSGVRVEAEKLVTKVDDLAAFTIGERLSREKSPAPPAPVGAPAAQPEVKPMPQLPSKQPAPTDVLHGGVRLQISEDDFESKVEGMAFDDGPSDGLASAPAQSPASADPFAAPAPQSELSRKPDQPSKQESPTGRFHIGATATFGDETPFDSSPVSGESAPPRSASAVSVDPFAPAAQEMEATRDQNTPADPFGEPAPTVEAPATPAKLSDKQAMNQLSEAVPRVVGGGSESGTRLIDTRTSVDHDGILFPPLSEMDERILETAPAPKRKTFAKTSEATGKKEQANLAALGDQERQLGRSLSQFGNLRPDSAAPQIERELEEIQLRTGKALEGLQQLSELTVGQRPGIAGAESDVQLDRYDDAKAKKSPGHPATTALPLIVSSLDVADEDFLSRKDFSLESKSKQRAMIRLQAPQALEEKSATDEPFSTFSLHVSDVSFKLAQTSLAQGEWPDGERIRIEEFVNAFDYGDAMPTTEEKVSCNMEQAIHPFLQQRNLLRVSMRTAAEGRSASTPLRLTLLLDNSGSMERIDRQETVRRAFALLTNQLQSIDQVTLISFARQPRLLADKVSGDQARKLVETISQLPSEGGTNLEAALQLAFEKAQEQNVEGAQNRIILLTDGAANLGDAQPDSLARKIEEMRNAGIAFDAAGIGSEGLNDEILEALTRKGDGRYYLLDRPEDADAGFARQIAGALRPAAGNVKVQIEFNPDRVGHYKLLGFEKHRLKKEDFRDDKVDAAEMAAEEAGVAVYQFEPMPDGSGDIGFASVRFRDMATGEMVEKRWVIPYQPDAPRPDQSAPSLRVATAASLLAAKLKGEALGDVVRLDELGQLVSELPSQWMEKKRVVELRSMIEKAREMEGQ